jgi:hypothetical protein
MPLLKLTYFFERDRSMHDTREFRAEMHAIFNLWGTMLARAAQIALDKAQFLEENGRVVSNN